MKHLKRLALSLLLVLSITVTAMAAEVPVSLVVENLNGQQRIVKTYELPPGTDPETLKEPSFEYDGFTYTWAYTTKEEHTFLETKAVTEKATVETVKKDLNVVLEQLAPTMEYDDGTWAGTLALDHTSISTQAAGYTTGSSTVTATKTIGPLDRNDMSYVPATTTKNGVTLNLSNVEWQVIGADVVGDVMAPCSYQAVATYSGKSYYKAATGYVTTANYVGEVTHEGVESVTYQVTYLGEEYEPEPSHAPEEGQPNLLQRVVSSPNFLRNVLGGAGVITAVVLTVLLILSRREVKSLRSEDGETDDEQEESGT